MSDTVEELKARVKKLSVQATNWKMNLHDLSEELPLNWENIMETAQKTHDIYAALSEARKQLAALE